MTLHGSLPLGCGGSSVAAFMAPQSDAEAEALLGAHWNMGVRYFDTAPLYGLGLSEERIGRFLRDKTGYTVSTKVGRLLGEGFPTYSGTLWAEPRQLGLKFDYSYDGIMRSFEDSLKRTGLDRFDTLLVHDVDRKQHGHEADHHIGQLLEGGVKALTELKRSGAISAFGLGVNDVDIVEELRRRMPIDTVLLAGRYTLLDHSARSLLDALEGTPTEVILGGVFNSGILAGSGTYNYTEAPQDIRDRVARLKALAGEFDVSLLAAAIQFSLSHPAVKCVLNSAPTPGAVTATPQLIDAIIPEIFWQRLVAEGCLPPTLPRPGRTRELKDAR